MQIIIIIIIITKREKLPNYGLCRAGGPQSQNHRKRKNRQVLRPFLKNLEFIEYKGVGDTNCNWCAWKISKKLVKRVRRVGNLRKNRDHLNYIYWDRPEYWEDSWRVLLSLRPSANAGGKNSQGTIIIIIMMMIITTVKLCKFEFNWRREIIKEIKSINIIFSYMKNDWDMWGTSQELFFVKYSCNYEYIPWNLH